MNINRLTKLIQMNFFTKLIKNNSGYSSKSFFLIVVTLIGCALLAVPIYCMIAEIYYNHTIQTDLNGMAAYIAAVAAVFGSVGITKAWSEKYENKNQNKDKSDG